MVIDFVTISANLASCDLLARAQGSVAVAPLSSARAQLHQLNLHLWLGAEPSYNLNGSASPAWALSGLTSGSWIYMVILHYRIPLH